LYGLIIVVVLLYLVLLLSMDIFHSWAFQSKTNLSPPADKI